MNYINLNGVLSTTITGLLISELPPISKPKIRAEIQEIDGRDGDIVTKLGYSAYDKELKIGLYGGFDINEVIAYFASEGTVIFSNEPDKYYNYQIIDQIDFERLLRFRTASIKMHVQPFKYSAAESAVTPAILKHVGPAAIASFSDGADAPLKSLIFGIEPKQDLHGYSYPWPGGGGKNLLPELSATVTQNGVTATKNADGTLHVTTTTVTANTEIIIGSVTRDNTKAYAVSGCPTGGSTSTYRQTVRLYSGTTSLQTLTDSGSGYIIPTTLQPTADSIRVSVWIASGQNNLNLTFKPMVEIGSSVTAYAPYSNICSISGWSQVDAVAAGANLLPLRSGSTTQNGQTFTPSNGTLVINGTANANSALYLKDGTTEGNKIYLPAGTYVVSGFEDYNDVNTYVGVNVNSTSGAYTATSKSGNHTFTVAEGDYVFPRARIVSGAVMDNYVLQPMIRRTSDASAFVPYKGTPITIPLGQTVYGGTVDAIAGKLTVDRVNLSINSFLARESTNTSGVYRFFAKAEGIASPPDRNTATTAISDRYKAIPNSGTAGTYAGNTGISVYPGESNIYVFDNAIKAMTLTEANAWVAANPIQVVYPLATPIEVDLTPVSVSSLLGQNNIWANTGNTEVVYACEAEIENHGNTFARPVITIKGSGTVVLMINSHTAMTMDMGSGDTITLDSEAMEAFYDGILKNRKCTGDFDNVVLKPGVNQIAVSGDVTELSVKNYSRWI